MPEKNEQKIRELEAEQEDLKSELENANKILQSKMDQVNEQTIVNNFYIETSLLI